MSIAAWLIRRLGAAGLAVSCGCAAASAQVSNVTIPFLANATRPADLDFEAAACSVSDRGATMRCEFQQVILTTSDRAPDTCLVTTNRYVRVFAQQGKGRWVSNEGPQGACGVVDVTTLKDDGGVRWTKETRKIVTKKDASPLCARVEEPPEVLSWDNIRRALPCKFVQPGGISP